MGTIPREAVEEIKRRAAFTPERIREIEKTTDHDVIAFTTALAENIGEAARFVHYGLTSSDVVDTANALLLRDEFDGAASHVVLAHLSQRANNPYVAKLTAESALRERGGLFQTNTKITLSHPKEPTPWIEL